MNLPILGSIDERFFAHRLRSTSLGGIAAVLVAAAFFFYGFLVSHIFRWDLFAIVLTAAVVKIAVLIWYRITD